MLMIMMMCEWTDINFGRPAFIPRMIPKNNVSKGRQDSIIVSIAWEVGEYMV